MHRNLIHRGIVMLAGLLLCLHTVIPHVHGSLHPGASLTQIGEKTDCVNEGLLHLIKDLLSSDLGEDHLENFTPDPQKNLSIEVVSNTIAFQTPFPVFNRVLADHISARQSAAYQANLPPDDPVAFADHSRGPPAIS